MQHIAGWVEPEPGEQPCLPAHFWDHHFILHRRFQHVLKDLDYTLQTAGRYAGPPDSCHGHNRQLAASSSDRTCHALLLPPPLPSFGDLAPQLHTDHPTH